MLRFLILVLLTVGIHPMFAQSRYQHTVSTDILVVIVDDIVPIQYELGLNAKSTLFARVMYNSEDIHGTGVQIGVDMSGTILDGAPIFETGTHRDIRFDLGYRHFFGKERTFGSGFFLEVFAGYNRAFDIEEGKPFLIRENIFGGGYGLGYRYVFPFNLSIGIDAHAFQASDGIGLMSDSNVGLHIGYVINKQERIQKKRRSRSR